MWICKHCKKEFSFEKRIDKTNHSRWCEKNPKRKQLLEVLAKNRKNASVNLSVEKKKQRNAKIKDAWKSGSYDNADFGKGFRNKNHSEKTKNQIAKKRKKFLRENPDKHPWRKNTKFTSEPCEYLKQKLRENNIIFIEEYQPLLPNRFFAIDIAFIEKKIGIEINGNQHYNKNGTLKTYYQNRHNLIEAAGWKLIELRYNKVYDKNILEIIKQWNQKNLIFE